MRTQDYHLDHSATQLISNHTCFCFQPLKRKKPHFKLSLKVFFLLSNSNEAAKMRRKLFFFWLCVRSSVSTNLPRKYEKKQKMQKRLETKNAQRWQSFASVSFLATNVELSASARGLPPPSTRATTALDPIIERKEWPLLSKLLERPSHQRKAQFMRRKNEQTQWGFIRCKQIARRLYLSRMKNVSSGLPKKYFWLVQYAAGYHPGPVAPPRTDGASLLTHSWDTKTLPRQRERVDN